jgi:hypothetical protein
MSGYKRFDRHEVFSMDDTSFVLDCINKTKWGKEDGATNKYAELTNMLYGLFDGFYYDKIHKYAAIHLSVSMFEQLEDILVKIDDSLIHVA